MALLVTDQGEIDSLRTLLNATHQIPRNLVLKLYTSNTTPAESDVPALVVTLNHITQPIAVVMVLHQPLVILSVLTTELRKIKSLVSNMVFS